MYLSWKEEKMETINIKFDEKHFKKVIQLDLNDNVLNVFESIKQAERETGVFATSISACCNGKRKSAGGFKWRKKNEHI